MNVKSGRHWDYPFMYDYLLPRSLLNTHARVCQETSSGWNLPIKNADKKGAILDKRSERLESQKESRNWQKEKVIDLASSYRPIDWQRKMSGKVESLDERTESQKENRNGLGGGAPSPFQCLHFLQSCQWGYVYGCLTSELVRKITACKSTGVEFRGQVSRSNAMAYCTRLAPW